MRLDRRMLPGACSAFASPLVSSPWCGARVNGRWGRALGCARRRMFRRAAIERGRSLSRLDQRARTARRWCFGRPRVRWRWCGGCGGAGGRGARSSRWNCASRCARSACACASVGRAFFAPEPAPRTGGRGSARFGAPGPAGFLSFRVVAIGRLDHGQGGTAQAPRPNSSRSASRYWAWPSPLVL